MKKTIFTFSAIAIVCSAIFFACAKDDNSAIHTTYVSQSSGGTGTNPDPNHTYTTTTTAGITTGGTTSGSTTSTTSTNTTSTVYSVTLTTTSGPSTGTISSSVCGGSAMYGTCSNTQIGTITVSFSAAPTAGSYNVVSTGVSAGQVMVSYNGNYADAGTVSIAVVGGKNVATFNSVTGTSPSPFTLAGGFGCP